MNWEIGEIPKGWNRGDPLRWTNIDFKNGNMAALMRAYDYRFPIMWEIEDGIAGIQFHRSEMNKVMLWYEWWNGKES